MREGTDRAEAMADEEGAMDAEGEAVAVTVEEEEEAEAMEEEEEGTEEAEDMATAVETADTKGIEDLCPSKKDKKSTLP